MILLLARHGNTFAPGEPVVWVGKGQDVPLVESGRTQAVRVAACLRDLDLMPTIVRCGPLSRARKYAAIIGAELGITTPAAIDPRLDEIDYGGWGGLTRDEVATRFGSDSIERWERDAGWPDNAGWGSSAEVVEREVRSIWTELSTIAPPLALLVSSNGRLRFFLKLVHGGWEWPKKAIRTGNVSILHMPDPTSAPRIVGWNLAPEEALSALRACMVK